MSDTLIATLGGLCAMLFWGTGDWMVARSSRKGGVHDVNVAFQIPGPLIAGALVLFSGQHVHSGHNIWLICVAGIIFGMAFIPFIKAFSVGSTGLVSPAASTYPLFALIITAIFLTVSFSHMQMLAILIILAGVMMLAYEKRNKKISIHVQHRATILALLTAFLWGLGNVIQNTVIRKEPWQIIMFIADLAVAITALVMWVFVVKGGINEKMHRLYASKNATVAGSIYCFGSFGFYYSSAKVGSVLIPLIVSSISPLITSGLGAIFDQERLTIWKRVGAAAAIVGVILINI